MLVGCRSISEVAGCVVGNAVLLLVVSVIYVDVMLPSAIDNTTMRQSAREVRGGP